MTVNMTKEEFIEQLAAIVREGECGLCGRDAALANPACQAHLAYRHDTTTTKYLARRLDTLIAQARQLTGRPNGEYEL